MKQEIIYNEVETLAKNERLMEKRYGVESFKVGEPYFTTSQETDIRVLISEGLTPDEIISQMRMW